MVEWNRGQQNVFQGLRMQQAAHFTEKPAFTFSGHIRGYQLLIPAGIYFSRLDSSRNMSCVDSVITFDVT